MEDLVHLAPEVEEGNVEYKRSLVSPSPERLEQLTSQLKWRLREGNGEALYELGVDDDGSPHGLRDEDLTASLNHLRLMAAKLHADVSLVCERAGKEGRVVEVLVREEREDAYVDVRVAVTGNVDAGKSTLVGVLTSGELDNGRGLARQACFNHRHELESGRTSSIGHQLLGFNAKGECVNHSALARPTWGDICERACKLVSLYDLAGGERYQATTATGLSAALPDYVALVVAATTGITRITREHLALAVALRVPLLVVLTKTDCVGDGALTKIHDALSQLIRGVLGARASLLPVRDNGAVSVAVKAVAGADTVPVFEVSSVTGSGLPLIKLFLNLVPPRAHWAPLRTQPAHLLVAHIWQVQNVGTVVGGPVLAGAVTSGDTLLIGPDEHGKFVETRVTSVHAQRVAVRRVSAGQTAAVAVAPLPFPVRRGMVLLAPGPTQPLATWTFEAEVRVLHATATISRNEEPVLQCLAIRQSARVLQLVDSKTSKTIESLRAGQRARVTFRFKFRPEYVQSGMRVLVHEGRVKALGIVVNVAFDQEEEDLEVTRMQTDMLGHPHFVR